MVKLVFTAGTVQLCWAGQAASVVELRQSVDGGVADLRGVDGAVERLGVDEVVVADGQALQRVGAVELGGARGAAAPASDGGGDDCAAISVYGNDLGTENAGDSWGR